MAATKSLLAHYSLLRTAPPTSRSALTSATLLESLFVTTLGARCAATADKPFVALATHFAFFALDAARLAK